MELNKAVLDCMQTLRRRLRAELGVDIRLSQPDAIEAMLIACLSSHDADTRGLGQRLAQSIDSKEARPKAAAASTPAREIGFTPSPRPTAPSESVRMYRGQRVYA
ncbi:MAG: hypothetical protein V4812_20290 [Pseudomonadota bacterium]